MGTNVRRLRTEHRWSIRELKEKLQDVGLHLSVSALSRMEIGQRKVSVDHLQQFAEVFDVSPASLLEPRVNLELPWMVEGRHAS